MNDKKFSDSLVTMQNQKNLSISGVEKVLTMNPTQVTLVACGQKLCITGENIEVEKLDVDNGLLKLKGIILALKYNPQKENLLKRIFK